MTTQDYKSAAIKLNQFSKDSYEFRKKHGHAMFDELYDNCLNELKRIFGDRLLLESIFGSDYKNLAVFTGILKPLVA